MFMHSIEAYVDDIVDKLEDPELNHLKVLPYEMLHSLHHSWGRGIRNGCGLWDANHPLTKHWAANPDKRDMREGVDFSIDHPDHVSMLIMQGVWKKVNA